MADASAVFLLAERVGVTPAEADGRTILRAWAINDYQPSVPQYIQLFLPENRVHVERLHAATMCVDELRYAIFGLAATTLGCSTLVGVFPLTRKSPSCPSHILIFVFLSFFLAFFLSFSFCFSFRSTFFFLSHIHFCPFLHFLLPPVLKLTVLVHSTAHQIRQQQLVEAYPQVVESLDKIEVALQELKVKLKKTCK